MREHDRLPWETAGGPEVGIDVSVTSEPRSEEKPGVPADPQPEEKADRACSEEREVAVRDPELSEQANERLTAEVREVVGDKPVRVPSDRPRPSRGERPPRQGIGAYLSRHRLMLVRTGLAGVVIGAVLALATGSWWWLPLAAGLHAFGTMVVATLAIHMTTISERPSPTTVAMLEEEGIRNPEEHFSNIVSEFSENEHGGAAEVISPGANERTVEAHQDPAKAAGEQSSAMTPSAGPSRPAGEAGVPELLNWAVVLGLLLLSLILPAAAGGGWLWLLTAVVLPLTLGWIVLQRILASADRSRGSTGHLPVVAGICATTAAVAGFCALVAFAFEH